MNLEFKTWVARQAFAEIAVLDMIGNIGVLSEGRKDPSALRGRRLTGDQGALFGDEKAARVAVVVKIRPLPVTPPSVHMKEKFLRFKNSLAAVQNNSPKF